MKILCVHNYYSSSTPSGENIVFENEATMLENHGQEVVRMVRHSDEILAQGLRGLVRGGLSTPWNPSSAIAISRIIADYRPDVVHVHNTFPLLSPSIFKSIGHRAARVLTLHNYRLVCPSAIPLRKGRICTDCVDSKSPWPALLYGCYGESRLATVPLVFSAFLHRWLRTWHSQIDAFIAPSVFQKELMVSAGLPAERVFLKPHFFPGFPIPKPWELRDPYVLFAGRLSVEKGVEYLIRAWLEWGESAPELRILGEGPLRTELQQLASLMPRGRIHFLGSLPRNKTLEEIAGARLLVLPSICYEIFSLALTEAFACGTPVAVSNIGPLPSIVIKGVNGTVFEPGNALSLYHEVQSVWNNPASLAKLGRGARTAFEDRYNEERNYKMLMQIYEKVVAAGNAG